MATTTTTSSNNPFQYTGKQPNAVVSPTVGVSPEQDSERQRKAQELLRDLKALIKDKNSPGIEIISDALLKAEELTLQAANNPTMDPETHKIFEDINALLVATRQLGENKQIVDRVQKIQEESAKALKAVNGPEISAATKETTQNLKEFMTNWRSVFYLITSSRDFRQFLRDVIQLVKRVVYSCTEDNREDTVHQVVESEPAKDTVKTAVKTKKARRAKKGRKVSREKKEKDYVEHRTVEKENFVINLHINVHDLNDEHTGEKHTQTLDAKNVRDRSSKGSSLKGRSPKDRSPKDRSPKDRSPRGKRVPEMSEEEWDRLRDDVQRVLVLLAKEPTYREAISRIFYLLDLFKLSIAEEPIQTAIVLSNVAAETEALVASFSGREILETFKRHLRNLILQIQQNENLQNYLHELKLFILKNRTEEEVKSEEFRTHTRKMAYRGRELMRELSQEDDLRRFLETSDEMIHNIKNDEFLQILRQHAGIVQSDLSYVNSEGKLKVDTDVLFKLQSALLPILAEALKYLPVPKIYSNDDEREFWLDNIVLCSYDILPEHIRFHIQSDSELSIREIEVKSHTYLVIVLDKLLTELKDVEFFYHQKTFPYFEEHGRATFRIKGNGANLTFTYTLDQEPQDIIPKIQEGYASFDISDIEFDFDKSTLNHDMIVPVLTKMFKTQIINFIEREVEKNLSMFIKKLGEMLMKSLVDINRPFLSGLHAAKKAVQSSEIGQIYEKRRELLE